MYTNVKRNPRKLYTFDPRLPQHRGIDVGDTNNFLVSIQTEFHGRTPSGWETILEITEILTRQCNQFEQNVKLFTEQFCGDYISRQLSDTVAQSESADWFDARWPLITASDSIPAQSSGEKLNEPPIPFLKSSRWLRRNFGTMPVSHSNPSI